MKTLMTNSELKEIKKTLLDAFYTIRNESVISIDPHKKQRYVKLKDDCLAKVILIEEVLKFEGETNETK